MFIEMFFSFMISEKFPENIIGTVYTNTQYCLFLLQNYKGNKTVYHDTEAVAYDDTYYIGKLEKIHVDNRKVQIKFAARSTNGYYSWPTRKDVDNVDVEFIFYCNILLVGAGKVGGAFIESEEDIAELLKSMSMTTCELHNECK